MMTERNFGEIEKELRLRRGLTIDDVAYGVGISKAAVSRYESGDREPAFHLIKYFCLFYNVSSDYLLGLTDDPKGVFGVTYDPTQENDDDMEMEA